MKKLTFYSLILVGQFFWLYPVYAADKAITPMLSLLLSNSGGTVITKSVSGQPGVVVNILLGDDHPAGSVQYVKMGDNEVVPVSWDDMTNEIQAMIPPVAAGQYQASVVFEDAQTPTIPLTVLPFTLPEGVTPDSVVTSVEQNMQTMFQSVTGFMGNAGYAQTNLNTLNGILSVFTDQYSQMTAEEKEFFATFLNNADIAGLLQEMEAAEAKVIQAKTTSIKRSPTKPSCMTVTPGTDEYTCKTYDRWDELAKYRSYYQFLKFIDTAVNNCISYVTDILGATDCVADAARFTRLTKAVSVLGTAINAAQTVLSTMPIAVTDLSINVNNTTLYYYDETGFTATATMEPASTAVSEIVKIGLGKVIGKLKGKVGAEGCLGELVDQVAGEVTSALGNYMNDENFQVDVSDIETVAIPPDKLSIETELYVEPLTTFCASPYTHYGKSLYVNESVAYYGGGATQVAEEVIFKYPYTLSHEYSLTDTPAVDLHVLTIKNRPPELENMTVSVDPENELKAEIIIDLDSEDQECDRITEWEVVGTAQYGTLDESFLISNELHYTLTNGSPASNEVLTLKFFDGLEWGEMTLTIDLSVNNCTYTSGADWVRAVCTETNGDGSTTMRDFYEDWQDVHTMHGYEHKITVSGSNDDSIHEVDYMDDPDEGFSVYAATYWRTTNKTQEEIQCHSKYNIAGCTGASCSPPTNVRLGIHLMIDEQDVLQSWCLPCGDTSSFEENFISCNNTVKGMLPSELSQHLYRGGCHEWWDHYDDQGNWVTCEE